ncbi:MAG: Ferredoxin [Actinomycetia bacterium]|nr:Ferredoxin [Actinomycetes bacterium]
MRVTIDSNICQGHGMCVEAAPAIFVMDDREHAVVSGHQVPAELEGAVRRAALLCPEEAITVHEQ